jgi:hypothetical protein
VKNGRNWSSGVVEEDGAQHPLLIGEHLVGARAGAVLQDAAFDLGGGRGR